MTAIDAARRDEFDVEVDGRTRRYSVVTPRHVTSPTHLVLVFHGSNQSAARFNKVTGGAFERLATKDGAVVAFLDGYRGAWNDARTSADFPARREDIDDVAFTAAVIDELATRHDLDARDADVVGFSNGGQMVIRLLHAAPERVRGAVIIGATQPTDGNFDLTEAPVVPRPVMLIHGTRDPIVPFAGGLASLRGFRPRGEGRSFPETVQYYVARNGLDAAPTATTVLPHRARSHKTSVTRRDYTALGRCPVTAYTVDGGGHTVPGPKAFPRLMGRTSPDVDSSRAAAEFLGLGAS